MCAQAGEHVSQPGLGQIPVSQILPLLFQPSPNPWAVLPLYLTGTDKAGLESRVRSRPHGEKTSRLVRCLFYAKTRLGRKETRHGNEIFKFKLNKGWIPL